MIPNSILFIIKQNTMITILLYSVYILCSTILYLNSRPFKLATNRKICLYHKQYQYVIRVIYTCDNKVRGKYEMHEQSSS
jgi:hypothetical protein